jgi:5-methylcytosine-specific restriction endonuclease McrA
MNDQLTTQKSIYQEGLEDPRWRRLREKILARDKKRCRFCGHQENLQVHHRQYHRNKATGEWSQPWEYHPFLLITACGNCHSNGHNHFPIPTKEI